MTTVAIDFGTSNTVVGVLEADRPPKILRLPALSRLFRLSYPNGDRMDVPVVPSLLFVKAPQHLIVGESVRSQRLGVAQPDRYFRGFKRDLVADFQPPPRSIDGQSYSAAVVAEAFLHTIWQAILQQSIQPTQVIFTVPVGAFERYLDWFRAVADRLDMPQVRLVDESTAAALGYAIQSPGTLVLVIDFGGGTLDLSVVRTTATTIDAVHRAEVIAKADAYVGGEDIDLWMVEDYLQQIGSSRQAIGEIGWQHLRAIAERLKIRLSGATEAQESWLDDITFTAHEWRFSRTQLYELLEAHQFLEHLRQAIDAVLATALNQGIRKSDIAQVVLVGGSCLIPAVQQLVLSYFGRQRVRLNQPFNAVVQGALVLGQLHHLEDYLHHSYAIRLWEPSSQSYAYVKLFDRGTRYPCQRPDRLTLQVATPGQREIRLDIGELAEIAQAEVTYDAYGRMTSTTLHQQESYRSLEPHQNSVCVAHLNPPGQVGTDRIAVQFAVTDGRMLVATVQDLLTGEMLVEQGAIAKLQ